jgi:hypothetical protein
LIDKYRLSYLGLSTEQVLLLERLGIGDEALREKVLKTLNLYGEELVGVIHIHHHALKLLAARQAAAGTDSELVQSARFEAERLELAVVRLTSVVTMLERLDGDTLAMRRVLIEKSGGLALSLVDTAMINVVFAKRRTGWSIGSASTVPVLCSRQFYSLAFLSSHARWRVFPNVLPSGHCGTRISRSLNCLRKP